MVEEYRGPRGELTPILLASAHEVFHRSTATLAKEAMRLAAHKLPIKTKFVRRNDESGKAGSADEN